MGSMGGSGSGSGGGMRSNGSSSKYTPSPRTHGSGGNHSTHSTHSEREDDWEILHLSCLANTSETAPRTSFWLRSDDSHFSADTNDHVTRAKLEFLEELLNTASDVTVEAAFEFFSILGKGNDKKSVTNEIPQLRSVL
jgi:hypothetical protein